MTVDGSPLLWKSFHDVTLVNYARKIFFQLTFLTDAKLV